MPADPEPDVPATTTSIEPEVVTEGGGDPVCWLSRVCPDCGRLAEGRDPRTCPACGADLSR